MNNTSSLLLLAEAAAPAPGGFFGSMPFMIIIMFAFMYLLIIRPQSKQRKEQAARIASLKKGDSVITAGGLHGSVHHISENTVTLKLSEGVFVPFEKSSITTVSKSSKGKASKEDSKAETTEKIENKDDSSKK